MSEKFFRQKFFFVNDKFYFADCYAKELLNKFCLLFNILAFIGIKNNCHLFRLETIIENIKLIIIIIS
jgi:hypothetical protein